MNEIIDFDNMKSAVAYSKRVELFEINCSFVFVMLLVTVSSATSIQKTYESTIAFIRKCGDPDPRIF